MTKSRLEQRAIARDIKVAEGVEAFMPDDNSMAETGSTWGVVNVGSSEGGDLTQELRVSSSKKPLVISKFSRRLPAFLQIRSNYGYCQVSRVVALPSVAQYCIRNNLTRCGAHTSATEA